MEKHNNETGSIGIKDNIGEILVFLISVFILQIHSNTRGNANHIP